MNKSVRSCLTTGVAAMTAAMIAFVPSVGPPAAPPRPAPKPTVQLVALVQSTNLPNIPPVLTVLLNTPLKLLGPAEPLGTGLPPRPAPLAIPIAPNLADTIDSTYLAVEPWVQYGFEVATAVVRWIPYVGWFAGLIMDGYFFGESLVASAVFNTTDWLRGNGGIVENVVDFGVDVGLAFVWLGLDALATFVPLPPCNCYPPRPPVQGPFLAAAGNFLAPAMKNAGMISGLLEKIAPRPFSGKLADIAAPGPLLSKLADIAAPGPLLGKLADIAAPGPLLSKLADIQTTEPPITRPFRDGKLAKVVQRFTHRDAPGGTTAVNVQTLGAGQNATEDQPRPRPHGLVGGVSSAVRHLVSSAPHPLRDIAAAAKPKKDKVGAPE